MSRTAPLRDPEVRQIHTRSARGHERHEPRTPYLTEDEIQALRAVGSFRVVNLKDMNQDAAMGLLRKKLVINRTMYQPQLHEEKINVMALTEEGREALEAIRQPGDPQQYWVGHVKPRELAHDMEIYRAYEKEREEIEAAGGQIQRVVLDAEFKSIAAPAMNKKQGPELSVRRKELGEKLNLPVHNNKLMLPDLRVEYVDAQGQLQHRDLEVVTRAYKRSMVAAKKASGFKLHNSSGSRAKVFENETANFFD